MPKTSKAGSRNPKNQAESPKQSPSATTPVKPLYRSTEMSPRARTISLVVGDIICFLIFASLGASQHGKGFNLLQSVWIAVPFIAGWFLVSPFVGAFRADIATSPGKMLRRTALSWLASWPVAMLFRWLLVDRVTVPPITFGDFLSFSLVALIFNTGLLLLWRWPFSLNNDLRKRGV